MRSRLASFLVAGAVLVGSAALYHAFARDSAELALAVARLDDVPLEVGEWKAVAVKTDEKDARSFEQAGAKAYWMRTYVNQRTQAAVAVILMCGRAGKMSVHTPEVCYHGAGYSLADDPSLWSDYVESAARQRGEHKFWTGQFIKKGSPATNLRLYWAWKSGTVWEAPVNARWHFRRLPFLYKLYVSRELSSFRSDPATDPAAELLRELLPEMDRSLYRMKTPG